MGGGEFLHHYLEEQWRGNKKRLLVSLLYIYYAVKCYVSPLSLIIVPIASQYCSISCSARLHAFLVSSRAELLWEQEGAGGVEEGGWWEHYLVWPVCSSQSEGEGEGVHACGWYIHFLSYPTSSMSHPLPPCHTHFLHVTPTPACHQLHTFFI